MSDETRRGRRRFLESVVATLAAAKLGLVGSANAQSTMTGSARTTPGGPQSRAAFAPLKQVDAGVLNVGYAEAGPANGPPVILLLVCLAGLTVASLGRARGRREEQRSRRGARSEIA